jgi:hypothetical protein
MKSNPGHRFENPAINRLNYVTAPLNFFMTESFS